MIPRPPLSFPTPPMCGGGRRRPGGSCGLKFVKTLRNWWQEFLNYFNNGVTQGFVEGINYAIRDIIRRAFGYRNFGNFRLQVLVECANSG